MKKIYFFTIMLLLTVSLNAQTTLAAQGFEDSAADTWSYTATPDTYDVSSDLWGITTTVGTIAGADAGTNFWGLRDIENSNGGGAFDHTLEFPNVSVTGESNILLTFKYYTDGYDSADELSVEYFFDDVSQGIVSLEKDTETWTTSAKVVPDGTANVRFTLIGLQNGGTDYAGFDSILLQSGANTNPSLSITSPTEGEIVNVGSDASFDVTLEVINFTLSNDDGSGATDSSGDGFIQYSVDSGAIINKFDLSAITLTGLPTGPHSISISLVDNNAASISIDDAVNFTINDIVQTLPLYESFDYTASENLADQPNWVNQNTGDEIIIGTGNLSYPGLASSTGNHAMWDGEGNDPEIEFTPVTSGEVYASFIFSVTDQSSITDLNDGGYFAVLGEFDARLWVRPNPDAASTTFDIGAGAVPSNPSFVGTYNIGDNILIVLSYNIDTNKVSLWVNPSVAELESDIAPSFTLNELSVDNATSISKFFLRQDSTGETPSILFDELRIGTSWADVTPNTLSTDAFNSSTFAIYPNPTNTGSVTISSVNSDVINVTVYDILGKQIKNETLNNNTLNVSDLSTGVYILKLIQNNSTVTQKLVIE
jgi:hypothetical protein